MPAGKTVMPVSAMSARPYIVRSAGNLEDRLSSSSFRQGMLVVPGISGL
jgi:hypothetical protein